MFKCFAISTSRYTHLLIVESYSSSFMFIITIHALFICDWHSLESLLVLQKMASTLSVDVGEDRIVLETRSNKYYLDIYLPYLLVQEDCLAQFNCKTRVRCNGKCLICDIWEIHVHVFINMSIYEMVNVQNKGSFYKWDCLFTKYMQVIVTF